MKWLGQKGVPRCLFFGLLLGFYSWASAADKLVIGISPSISATLDLVAEKQGCFAEEGLAVELRLFSAGNLAVTAMLNGEIDLAESAIFAVAANSFSRRDFRILTTVAVIGNDNMVVARKGKGIRTLQDLKGKKVGVLKGGFPHYVLDLMLMNAGMASSDLQIVFDKPETLVDQFGAGDLDAACLFGAWIDKLQKAITGNSLVFHEENLVRVNIVLTGKSVRFEKSPELYTKLLKAYLHAEKYIKENPDAAMEMVAKTLNIDPNSAKKSWKPNLFGVVLDQSLITDMENMAQWQIDIGAQNASVMPNYLDFVEFGILSGVDPGRVKIVH